MTSSKFDSSLLSGSHVPKKKRPTKTSLKLTMDKELMPQILFPQVLAYQNQHSEPFEIIPVNT